MTSTKFKSEDKSLIRFWGVVSSGALCTIRHSALIVASLFLMLTASESVFGSDRKDPDPQEFTIDAGFYRNVEDARAVWKGSYPVELSGSMVRGNLSAMVFPCKLLPPGRFNTWQNNFTESVDLSGYEYIHLSIYIENAAAVRHLGIYFGVEDPDGVDSQKIRGWYARLEHSSSSDSSIKEGWNTFSWKREHFGIKEKDIKDGWKRIKAVRMSFWGDQNKSEAAKVTLDGLFATNIPPKNKVFRIKSEGDLLGQQQVPIIPVPQTMSWTKGAFQADVGAISMILSNNDAAKRVVDVVGVDFGKDGKSPFLVEPQLSDIGLVAIIGDGEGISEESIDNIKKRANLRDEGYCLEVKDNHILLIGKDERGFYYGFKTLQQLWNVTENKVTVDGVVIVDYPSLAMRGMYLHRLGDIEKAKTVIEGLSALKINTVFIDLASELYNDKYPFPASSPRAFSKDQMKELVDFANRHNVTLCPYYQMFSHMAWLAAEPAYRHLLESDDPSKLGWHSAWCPSNPETYEFAEELISEAIEIFQPPYVHIGHDEMAFANPPVGSCERCRGNSREALIAKSVNRLSAFIESKGSQAIIWNDTLLPWAHGLVPPRQFDTDLLMSLIDRGSLIINTSNYSDKEESILRSVNHLEKNNFENIILSPWYNERGIKLTAQAAKTSGAIGALGTVWHEWGRFVNYPNRISDRALPAIGFSAAYFWNVNSPEVSFARYDWNYKVRSMFEPTYETAEDSTLNFSEVTWPDSLSVVMPSDSKLFKISIPMSLNVEKVPFSQQFPIILSGSSAETYRPSNVDIPVGKEAMKVYFLHTLTPPFDRRIWERRATVKPDVGSYVIHYEDSTKETIPLKHRWNINDWNTSYGAIEGRVAWQGENADGELFRLYCLEWENPHPDKIISKIEFTSTQEDGMNPVLLAVTIGSRETQ